MISTSRIVVATCGLVLPVIGLVCGTDGARLMAAGSPVAPTNRVIVQDDFSDPNSGWQTTNDADGSYGYVAGEYRFNVKRPSLILSVDITEDVDDFGLQVEVRPGGPSTPVAAGFKFGTTLEGAPTRSWKYFFVWPATGQFGVLQSRAGVQAWLISPTTSTAIRTGGAKNLLRIERRGADVRLMINGQEVRSMSLPHDGPDRTGLSVWHVGATGEAEAYFDNYLLEALDDSLPTATATPKTARTAAPGTRPAPVTSTPTAVPLPTPIRSNYIDEVLKDDFSQPSSGWRVYHGSRVTQEYVDGEYRMRTALDNGLASSWHELEVADFDIQVDVRLQGNDDFDGAGVAFGRTNDSGVFYTALIAPKSGLFVLAKLRSAEFNDQVLCGATPLSAIRRDSAVNRLRLISDGTRVSFFINGVPACSVNLAVPLGHLGLALKNGPDTLPVDGYFDNLLVTAPPGSSVRPPALPTYGTVKIADDFSSAGSGWPERDSGSCSTKYVGGEYRVSLISGGCRMGLTSVITNGVFDVSVEARSTGTNGNAAYGLVFGDGWLGFGYEFVVVPDWGAYFLDDNTGEVSDNLIPISESAAINRGSASNRLRVVTTDDYIILLVNDVRLGSVRRTILGDRVGFSTGYVSVLPFDQARASLVPELPGSSRRLMSGSNDSVETTQSIDVFFDNFRFLVPGAIPTPRVALPMSLHDDPAVLFSDDFSDPASGWLERPDRWYRDGQYRLIVSSADGLKSVPSPRRFADLGTYEVAVTSRIDRLGSSPRTADRNVSGILFGFSASDDISYAFLVDPSRREFAVARIVGGKRDPVLVLPWTMSHAIQALGRPNRLHVVRRDGALTEFYANDVLLGSAELPFLLGVDGLVAEREQGAAAFIATFDDYEVRRLPEGPTPARGGARTPTPLHRGTAPPPATPADVSLQGSSPEALEIAPFRALSLSSGGHVASPFSRDQQRD